MRPMISNTPYYQVKVPEFSGGVNLRDGISLINDNQLTDVKNMWYRDGALKTRAALKCLSSTYVENDFFAPLDVKVYADEKNYRVINGKTYQLVCFQGFSFLKFRYYPCDGSDERCVEVVTISADDLPPFDPDYTCNIFQFGSDIYCFCSGYYGGDVPYYIYKISEVATDTRPIAFEYKRVGMDEETAPYIPTVFTNGTASPPSVATTKEDNAGALGLKNANYIEGLNLLGEKMRLLYTTVNPDYLTKNEYAEGTELDNVAYHVMVYAVPHITKFTGEAEMTATITYSDGRVAVHKLTVVVDPDPAVYDSMCFESNYNSVDGLCMQLYVHKDKEYGYITFLDNDADMTDGYGYVTEKERDMLNNMEVIAPCPNPAANYEKVMNMTFNEWYGSDAKGIYGGIHLFMGGNYGDDEALVIWSDFNKPLYFSENNYAYVGDKSQRVTAFGKQGEALIIFKEREVFATQYTTNDEITAEDVENQTVVDVAANEAYFPMVQVHGFIGCDCPKSVQLCRNRLVWAHSDGKVYTLTSANQFSERSIFEVSGMVEPKIRNHLPEEIRGALSCDWNGYYVLIIGNDIFLMDYNSYGYSNVYSYSKTDDAQKNIPWWIWETPEYVKRLIVTNDNGKTEMVKGKSTRLRFNEILSVGSEMFAISFLEPTYKSESLTGEEALPEDGEANYFVWLNFESTATQDKIPHYANYHGVPWVYDDSTYLVPTMLQTKFFDFGGPTVKKNVPKIEVSFGANGGVPIRTVVIDERGESETEFVIDEPEKESRSVAYVQNKLIRPPNKNPYRISVKFESKGGMAVDSLSLIYKNLRGLK